MVALALRVLPQDGHGLVGGRAGLVEPTQAQLQETELVERGVSALG